MKTKLYKTGILMMLLLSGFWVLAQSTGGITWLLPQISGGDKGNKQAAVVHPMETSRIPRENNSNNEAHLGSITTLHRGQLAAKAMYEAHFGKAISDAEFGTLIRATRENLEIWTAIQHQFKDEKSSEEMEYVNLLVEGLTVKTK